MAHNDFKYAFTEEAYSNEEDIQNKAAGLAEAIAEHNRLLLEKDNIQSNPWISKLAELLLNYYAIGDDLCNAGECDDAKYELEEFIIQYAEKGTKGIIENCVYRHTHPITEEIHVPEFVGAKYSIKDIVEIPIHGKYIPFVVEHISHYVEKDRIFFVAQNIVSYEPMQNIDDFLDKFEEGFPRELAVWIPTRGRFKTRRMNLLSITNLGKGGIVDENYDEIPFEGLKNDICKRNAIGSKGEWWTGSHPANDSEKYYSVNEDGKLLCIHNKSCSLGVVPYFVIDMYKYV